MMRLIASLVSVLVPVLIAACAGENQAESADASSSGTDTCARLVSTSLPETTIVSARVVSAGAFTPPAQGSQASRPIENLPAFCRVVVTMRPVPDEVAMEVWLPVEGWGGDFQPAGSSFWGGSIPYGRMGEVLRLGVATAGTNLGITGASGPSFAIEHPEKLAYLADVPYHAMIERAKGIIRAYYGRGPVITYMDECGGGGSRDALAMVQRHPEDLDAAAAIGFTNYGTRHGIHQMWVYQATHKTPGSYIPPATYPLIHKAALNACDAKDGVADGIIEDPMRCRYDPAVLLCKGGEGADCLTKAQVEAVRAIYTTPVHGRTKEPLYGLLPPGSELGWEPMAGPTPYPYSVPFYRYLVFKNPKWDYKTDPINFESHVDLAETPQNLAINATRPDISRFIDRGGKLLLVGGWAEHTLAPGNNVDYYESIVRTLGTDNVRNSVRLFMVPGMDHCFDEEYEHADTYRFDVVAFLKAWKLSGQAPDRIVVTHAREGERERKRLVCAYPQIASYNGSGPTDDPANFSCSVPRGD
jgi:feruloyl esterase